MTLDVASITFDCADALAVATFWSQVLGQPIDEPSSPGEPAASKFFASIGRNPSDGAGTGPRMMFIAVPEPKSVKYRVHLDLAAGDRARRVERPRLRDRVPRGRGARDSSPTSVRARR